MRFNRLLAPFRLSFGALQLPVGALWFALGSLRVPFGSLLLLFGCFGCFWHRLGSSFTVLNTLCGSRLNHFGNKVLLVGTLVAQNTRREPQTSSPKEFYLTKPLAALHCFLRACSGTLP